MSDLTKSFDQVAKEIIMESIKSALLVDDELFGPYDQIDKSSPNYYDVSKSLYENFKKNNCFLEILRFENFDVWNEVKENVLKNRDLFILDWKLERILTETPLFILEEAINNDSLPFVVIYTQERDIEGIRDNIYTFICSEINSKDVDKFQEFKESLVQEIDCHPSIEESNVFSSSIKDAQKYINDIWKGIKPTFKPCEIICKSFNKKNIPVLKRIWEEIYNEKCSSNILNGKLIELIAFSNTTYFKKEIATPKRFIVINDSPISMVINGTQIIILNKKEIEKQDNNFANEFSKALLSNPNSFLLALALELKNKYRDKFSVISNEFINQNEDPFFHQFRRYKDEIGIDEKLLFKDFVMNHWKNHISFFHANEDLQILDLLEEHHKMMKSLPSVCDSDLIKLNSFLSTLTDTKSEGRKIQFGDVFKNGNIYFLCITPHCDCLRAKDKVKNNFIFVSGRQEMNTNKSLLEAEKGLYSFICDHKPISVKWRKNPISFYITDEKNNISDGIDICWEGKHGTLMYVCTQFENYTQRISNAVFANTARIGINYSTAISDEVDD